MNFDQFIKTYPVELTENELKVLRCLIDGDSNKAIAAKTGININTIKRYLLQSIFRKLGVNNRTKAAVWGYHQFNDS